MINVIELSRRIDGMYAEPRSDEGQAEINDPDSTHVLEVWQDGELTITKNGDLYRHRRLHQSERPLIPYDYLFKREDFSDEETYSEMIGGKDIRMVVTDRTLVDILDEYRSVVVDKQLIDFLDDLHCPECLDGNIEATHNGNYQCKECNAIDTLQSIVIENYL